MRDDLRMHADRQIEGGVDAELIAVAAEVFRMLADPTRVRIVLALGEYGELSVNHLADIVDKAAPAVSQHLAKLRLTRMVSTRQDGTRVFYRLTDEHAQQLVNGAIQQAEHALDARPAHHHPAEVDA
jgi:DNA-binding transcriptional ArsR family regulator